MKYATYWYTQQNKRWLFSGRYAGLHATYARSGTLWSLLLLGRQPE